MSPREHRDAVRLIDRAWRALDAGGFSRDLGKLMQLAEASEKRHRRGAPDGTRYAITLPQAARMSAVRSIAQSIETPGRYSVADVLSIREDVIYAQAIATVHADAVRVMWSDIDRAALIALDYVDLITGPQ